MERIILYLVLLLTVSASGSDESLSIDIKIERFNVRTGQFSVTITNKSLSKAVFVEMKGMERPGFSLNKSGRLIIGGRGGNTHPLERVYCLLDVENPKYPTYNARSIQGELQGYQKAVKPAEWKDGKLNLSFVLVGIIEGSGKRINVRKTVEVDLNSRINDDFILRHNGNQIPDNESNKFDYEVPVK